ncbi:RTA1 domain-containing protein [Rhizoctonia solani AG-1 IA]|uniref:RTA1 domain-containing protein n=1 Tax=Thanatephorus cucumeris (strain AG1-IA) TaxID=983506 RepID=L8WPA3_THACA|nr:RTA1 domain-containing protein [Rhizoctonia solani AG-1 IA]
MSTSLSLALLSFYLLPAVHAASTSVTTTPQKIDPFTDAKNDPRNPLRYIPSKELAWTASVAYFLVVLASIAWSFKYRARYMLTLMISGALYALGLYFRTVFAKDPHNISKFIAMHMLIVLSPCGLIVYMLLGRLAMCLNANDLLLIKPSLITKVYVVSLELFQVTLLIQAGGGSMGISDSESMRNIGSKLPYRVWDFHSSYACLASPTMGVPPQESATSLDCPCDLHYHQLYRNFAGEALSCARGLLYI